jgi:hypothetical protein
VGTTDEHPGRRRERLRAHRVAAELAWARAEERALAVIEEADLVDPGGRLGDRLVVADSGIRRGMWCRRRLHRPRPGRLGTCLLGLHQRALAGYEGPFRRRPDVGRRHDLGHGAFARREQAARSVSSAAWGSLVPIAVLLLSTHLPPPRRTLARSRTHALPGER